MDRITTFVAENSDISKERYNELVLNTGELVMAVDRRQEKQLSGREDRERKAENGRETTDDGQKDRPGLKTKTIRHPPKQSGT